MDRDTIIGWIAAPLLGAVLWPYKKLFEHDKKLAVHETMLSNIHADTQEIKEILVNHVFKGPKP